MPFVPRTLKGFRDNLKKTELVRIVHRSVHFPLQTWSRPLNYIWCRDVDCKELFLNSHMCLTGNIILLQFILMIC